MRRGRFQCSDNTECVLDGVAGTCEAVEFCSFPDPACSEGGRRFGEWAGDLSNQCVGGIPDAAVADIAIDAFPSACMIPGNAIHAWSLDIPLTGDHNVQVDVPYLPDNRSALASMSFARIGYCLQLDNTFVYTEMDDFTTGMIADTGIPTEKIFETTVANLTIRTNAPTVAEVTLATGGSIELWGHCYSAGVGTFDTDDAVGTAQPDCYGSFQVHHMTTIALAYNRWSGAGTADVGIGNQTVGNPDWTFAQNAAAFAIRRLQAFVLP